ncbi:MAG TPA: DNA-processing protein DprA [Sphaerochaeta sp.]|nr:DNA-processing protein DprA [Sphaerochaeta sp.]
MRISRLLSIATLNLPTEEKRRLAEGGTSVTPSIPIQPMLRFFSRPGNKIVFYGMTGYPPSLIDLENPPFMLSYSASLPEAGDRIIALAGSRQSDYEGLRAAYALGKALAETGFTLLVSNSSGFDRWARLGSQSADSRSFVLCDCGLGTKRITSNRSLRGEHLISPFLPYEEVSPQSCLSRNVLTAALSTAVIIGQAPKRSGALHVAGCALDLGKDVFVHQSGIGSKPNQEGSRFLHQSGAPIVGGDDPDQPVVV